MEKTVICEENIFLLYLSRKFLKKADLSLLDHKFDLIYCHCTTTESDTV